MKKPIKCILFDCDGVLVDSEPIALSTLVYQANQLGVDIDLDFAIQYFKGHSLEEVIATLAYFRKNPIPTNFEQTYRTITFDRFKNGSQILQFIFMLLRKWDLSLVSV